MPARTPHLRKLRRYGARCYNASVARIARHFHCVQVYPGAPPRVKCGALRRRDEIEDLRHGYHS